MCMIKRLFGARKELVSSFLMPIVARMSQSGINNSTAFKHESSRYKICVGQSAVKWTFHMFYTAKVSLSKDALLALF